MRCEQQYCQSCIQGDYCKANWTQATLTEKEKIPSGVDVEINDLSITASNEMETEIPSHKQHNEEHFAIGDYVAATYLNKWYIGKILAIDEEDCDAEITFMQRTKKLFQWPKHADTLWVNISDILLKIKEPLPARKSQRMYKLCEIDEHNIEHLFDMKSRYT